MGKSHFMLSLVVVILFLNFVCSFSMESPNITTDRFALLALKSHVTSDPKRFLATNWSTSTSVCNWIGVTCGSKNLRVTVLNLTGMGLVGTIPSHLGNLSFLSRLNIMNNSFQGLLPNHLANLHRLKFINLGNNKFGGEIPSWFGSFTRLQNLYLFGNNFTGLIPSSLCHLPKLESLNLGNNNLRGQIPVKIGNLSTLKTLHLGTNHLSGQIPGTIGDLKNLERLRFSENNLTGPVPSSIGNLTFLSYLAFSSNSLSGALPFQIGNLQNLETLFLGNNSFSGSIPPPIFNISTALMIWLGFNQLSGQLPSTAGLGLPKLEGLYLELNELSGPIPTFISNASNLIFLQLTNNSFSGTVPDTFGNLKYLQRLDLGHNNLSSKPSSPVLSFLSSLTSCKSLEVLIFDDNPLINGELPVSVGNLSASLTLFYASHCNIKGSIPGEIGNLSKLFWLGLDHNDFTGTIPATLGRLRELQDVDLGSNKLEGSIPSELCHLERLAYLTLTDNKLFGPIPECLGHMVSLRNLFLGSNSFTSIPSTLSRLDGILFLELSSNSLNGSLPTDIGNWKSVTNLNLSDNQFSGAIPSSIADLMHLTRLSLSGNMLQGSIPASFDELISLEYLDLSRNNLSGMIPKSLEKLQNLKYFNVSFNRLQGEIPSRGLFGNYSSQSFIGNKDLCGPSRLQVPPCKTDPSKSANLLKYILPVIGSVILVTVVVIILLRSRNTKTELPIQENLPPLPEWRRISYHDLAQATDGFSESNLLGVGSFGSVYKGTLSTGMTIAVKVFHVNQDRAFKSFDIECEVLRNIRHRNLVKIISSCSNVEFKALVLEFMSNGSLEKWLYSHDRFLNVLQRLNIVIDIALALEYLHHGHTLPVVHCDIKPNNILLDTDMIAHLGDFGIAKLLGEEDSTIQTKTLATIGYMSPEYGSEGIVSTKGDVYSFGILVMETFTRKKPTDDMFGEEMSLKRWVKESLPSSLVDVVDSELLNTREREGLAAKDCIVSILQLALECSAEVAEERIDMEEVVARLKKIKTMYLRGTEQV
ncbi:hypothetical protein Goshw_016095 [Gossypium schwendimanii]|uniref:non-specific serine/threonine protein kinase n=1 Tax=Gossypium schwendimanii TaxID=34291 RepID=A0A7J9KSR2_GOSSC|nr:hypothetical protein [Gossypium schwendimanii]